MAVLKRGLVYALADVLGMTIHYDGDKETLAGKDQRTVNLSGLTLTIEQTIVSSLMVKDVYMVMVKSVGNLALFVTAKEVNRTDAVDLHILNLARMDAAHDWLEKHNPKSVNSALALLGPAVVASFAKLKKNEWSKAA